MTLTLYGHPFSSYTWKVLIPLYEKGIEFDFRSVDPEFPDHGEELRGYWPMGKFPLLVHNDRVVFEATSIIDYLEAAFDVEPRLIPADPVQAVEVRQLDRIFDNHVMSNMQAFVDDAMRPENDKHASSVAKGKSGLDIIYPWLDTTLAGKTWAHASGFSLADCAAAPSLFYADWVYPIPDRYTELRAYRARLLARPSVARCVEGARPYRHYFPLSAPDRD